MLSLKVDWDSSRQRRRRRVTALTLQEGEGRAGDGQLTGREPGLIILMKIFQFLNKQYRRASEGAACNM